MFYLKNKSTIKTIYNFKLTRKSCLIFFLLLTLIFVNSAFAIKITKVKHLFDITHNFSQPSDIAVSRKGLIYVVDGVNNKIKVFNQNGKFLFSFGKGGKRKGEFRFPLGIDIDRAGKVYIADSGNQRIQIFSPAGSFLTQINIPSKNDNPADPTDVVVNDEKNLCYIIDNNNHYVLVYDISTLEFKMEFGEAGTEKRQFRYPFFVAKDKDNYIYIVDVVNTRVQVFSQDGIFSSIIGGWGVEKGEFFRPKGVGVDKNNNVYVSDSYTGVIQVFERIGGFFEFKSAVGGSATGDSKIRAIKKFTTPVGIYIDNNNRLYVVEMFAEKVSVYSIEDTK